MLTNKRKEKISAFLDNDMHRDELMSFSLSAETDDAGVVQRYQILGDALRGEMSDSSFVDVSHAVREALANENIADGVPVVKSEHSPGKQGTTPAIFDISAWLRPIAGMAVAASVAVVMVVTLSGQEGGAPTPVATSVELQPVVRVASDDQAGSQPGNQPGSGNVNNLTPSINRNLANHHLVNQHLEFATQDALQGRLPYVRAVSYEAEK